MQRPRGQHVNAFCRPSPIALSSIGFGEGIGARQKEIMQRAVTSPIGRNPVYGRLAVRSFARVEYSNDRHSDECCRAVTEVTIRSHARLRWPVCKKSSRPLGEHPRAKVTSRKIVK